MIEVTVRHVDSGVDLARIRIENTHDGIDDDHRNYSVRFAADRCGAVGLHQRGVYAFPYTKYNVLALLRQVLNTLEPSELELEHGTRSSDLAGRFKGIGRKIQGWKS